MNQEKDTIWSLRAKLAVAKDIAEDFRANTSLGTIIREYEARIKELEKGGVG